MREHLLGHVHSYSVFLAFAVFIGVLISFRSARASGLGLRDYLLFQASISTAALFGAKLWSLAERGWSLQPLGWELGNGYRYPGGLLAAAAVLVVLGWSRHFRLSIALLADIAAPGTAFAMATIRVGCFLAGCCYGTLCTLPWCLSFPRGSDPWRAQVMYGLIPSSASQSLPVHPLQIYFLLLSLGVGIYLLRMERRKSFDGQVFLAFLVLHESGKFLLEFFRHEQLWHLQVGSLAAALAGAAVLIVCRLRSTPRTSNRPVFPATKTFEAAVPVSARCRSAVPQIHRESHLGTGRGPRGAD